MSDNITSVRRRRGIIRGRLTRIERDIADLERKEELADQDQRTVERLLEQIKDHDASFETRHLEVLDLIKEDDEDTLKQEEEVFDEHVNRVAELTGRLERLNTPGEVTATRSTTAAPNPSGKLAKRLKFLEQQGEAIAKSTRSPPSGTEDHPKLWLQKCQKDIGLLTAQLAAITGEILAMPEEDTALLTNATSIQGSLSELDYEIVRQLYLLEDTKPSEVPLEPTVELPKISVPTFDGDVLNWAVFWEQFETAIHNNRKLHDAQKLTYLRDAVEGGPAKKVIQGLAHSAGTYQEAVKCLQQRFDRPRFIHQKHVKTIVEIPTIKVGTGKELRQLHDLVSQHVRSLRTVKGDTFESFLSSLIEMKLDQASKFAWQQHTHERRDIPSIDELLEFVDWRAQASELSTSRDAERKHPITEKKFKTRNSYQATTERRCAMCNEAFHPLYACASFRTLPHEERLAIVRKQNLCMNCLRHGHFSSQCQSSQKCKKCSGAHHTLLHRDASKSERETVPKSTKDGLSSKERVSSNFSNGNHGSVLLMTCQVVIRGPNGSTAQARALLDSGSETSFITERLAQQLRLSRRRGPLISCIGETTPLIRPKGLVDIRITDIHQAGKVHSVQALVLPKITTTTPAHPVSSQRNWTHLTGLSLADPDYGIPGSVDLLLGADMFSRVVLHGRRYGPSGSPSAFKTQFGWVLTGSVQGHDNSRKGCYFTVKGEDPRDSDELLKRFWEIENPYMQEPMLSINERKVVEHFKENHRRDTKGRFIVPLPLNPDATPLGESRSRAIRRFKNLEQSLYAKEEFEGFARCILEYIELDHAELVPEKELQKPHQAMYYMPMHAVRKESSTTTKLRVVFDASAKSTSGASLNDQFLVGPTVHPSLVDVLMRFRRHKIAMTTDVSKMYRAVFLPKDQRDLHRFVWRKDRTQTLQDYRMTRLTFGISASSFAANMALKQNALDFQKEHPLAAQATEDCFYVDDGLVGADSTDDAIHLRGELQHLFSLGGFTLRKWRTSDKTVEESIPAHLRDQEPTQLITCTEVFTRVLGVEWNATTDAFRPLVPANHEPGRLTKRKLLSEVAKLFDVLGWCSPAIIIPKMLLQRLWEEHLNWDELVSPAISKVWENWSSKTTELRQCSIRRSYFPKEANIRTIQLHGFCDASEVAYAGVVYLRGIDAIGTIHTSLVVAKTKVAPIKRITIPRLELCGALIMARLLKHTATVLNVPEGNIYAWTDSRVVLGWLRGDPRRFKVFVGNRVAEILELMSTNSWRHVSGKDNPADCASRGLYPDQLANHLQWWQGPEWLKQPETQWPMSSYEPVYDTGEERNTDSSRLVLLTGTQNDALPLLRHISSYSRLIRITSWIFRYIYNSRHQTRHSGVLSTDELQGAERFWIKEAQRSVFSVELNLLQKGKPLPRSSKLIVFRPFIDGEGLLRVGGRIERSKLSYAKRHPVLLPRDHKVVDLLITYEHLRLLHAGPTLVAASLAQRFCIIRGRRTIRAKIRNCVMCKRIGARAKPQILGQLPEERINPQDVFDNTGVDYAGPIYIKTGSIRKPIITKGYVAVFVSFSVKAVHLEPVTELTTSAFIATLRRFIARRGMPITIWSDNGSNFVGAAKEIKRLVSDPELSNYCSHQGIRWKFTPEHAPHFGGLWEASVKSFKQHLRRIVGEAKLTYEELTTTLAQIEACLNSRPLIPLPEDSEGLEVLTPGHFLIGKPLMALPNPPESRLPITMLRRWNLCQKLTTDFWSRWSKEYLITLNRLSKWQSPTQNLQVGDIVCLRDEPTIPTKWPLARITDVYPGKDGKVRVVTVRTPKGSYRRPIVKIVPLVRPTHTDAV